MYRIDGPGAVATKPAPKAAGTEGWFTEADPATGSAGTAISNDWLNMVQEELGNVTSSAGVTRSKTANNQLLTAMQSLFGNDSVNASPGRRHLGGGTIVRWGTGTTGAGGSVAVTYGTAFPTATLNVQITHSASAVGAVALGAGNLTASGFTAYAPSAAAVPFQWFAIGH